MANEQIQVESLSPTPLDNQEEERTVQPFDVAETVPEPEIKAIEREPVPTPTVEPTPPVDPLSGPVIPPDTFVNQVRKGGKSGEELSALRTSTAKFYKDYVLGQNLPEGGSLDRRMELINNATYYRIPQVDEKGNIKKSEDGRVLYASNPIPLVPTVNPDNRVLQMFEFAKSNNGVYHFFTGDQNDPNARAMGAIDIGLQKMQRRKNNPLEFLSREETQEGGMKNYIEILKRAGFKDPARLTYLARQQAESDNIFEGVEATRTGAGFRDMAKFFADIGYGEGFQIPFTDTKVGLGKPLVDATALAPIYLLEAATLGSWRPEGMSFDDATKMQLDMVDSITKGKISWETFDDAATKLQKEYPHATMPMIEAVLTYSPDLQTVGSRFATESVGIGGTITGVMRRLGKAERMGFVEHVRELTGTEDKLSDIGSAIGALEKKGLDATKVLKDYYEKRGLSSGYSNLAAKALDMDIHHATRRPGPFYDNVIKPQLDDAQKRLESVNKKLDAAYEQGRSPKLIKSLEAQRDLLRNDVLNYQKSSYLPPYVRDYLKDEGIATSVGAVAYQATYDASNGNDMAASMSAFLFSVVSATPRARDITSNSVEDIAIAIGMNGDEKLTSKAAVRIRRHLEKAPPELREQILQFMEAKAVAVEELSMITFPKGHPREGQPIINEDALDQSFAQMSGLLTLRRLEKDLAESSLNIQKDAGKFSENLYELEQNFMQQATMVDAMAQHIDSLRYYRFSDQYDPSSETGQLVDTLVNFYDDTVKGAADRKVLLQDALDKRDLDLNRFFSGQLPMDDMEGILNGSDTLGSLLAVDRARYMDANVAPDATLDEKLAWLDQYYKTVNAKMNDAFEANARFTFDPAEGDMTANNMFRSWVDTQESRAYAEASARFDSLRQNPLYADARMDVTEVLDAFIKQGADGNLGVNTAALQSVMPIYGEGTQTSRYLARLNLPSATTRAISRLFAEGATEYLDDFGKKVDAGTLQQIFEDAELDEGASALDKWFAVRNFFDENKSMFGDNFDDMYPRLGVAPDVFMHVVSSLGRSPKDSAGLAARQLRNDLLERAPNEFFDNFYGSKSERTSIDGFAEDYKNVRQYYRSRYIEPFREESSVVRTVARDPDAKIRANALDNFLNEVQAKKEGVDLTTLSENFYKVLESVTGGKIDVTTDAGKQIRAILTKRVQAEIASLPASRAIRRRLIRDYAGDKAALVRPEDVQEIQRSMEMEKAPLMTNLLRTDPRTGKYLFADVNGEPLIDPSVVNTNSFDELIGYGIREAEEAQIVVRDRINAQSDEMIRNMDNRNSDIGGVIHARKNMVERLGQGQGLGSELAKLANTEGGVEKIAQLKQDYVYARVQDGDASDMASAHFDQAVKDAALEHVMELIMKPGPNVPSRTIDMATGESRVVVQRAADMDIDALGKVLGVTGDTVGASRQEGVMRTLLGDDVYNHMRAVFDELYTADTKQRGVMNVTGKSIPLSAESMLSRGTSFFRGVISLRWLVSEAAIRHSREANYQLTKMMLGNPKVGREVLQMLTEKKFDLDKREPEFVSVLLTEIAKFDALQEKGAMEQETEQAYQASGLQNQMQSLMNVMP